MEKNNSTQNTRKTMGHSSRAIRPAAEKPKDFKGTMRKLLGYMAEFRASIFAVVFFSIVGTLFAIVGPMILSIAITELADGMIAMHAGNGSINFERIGTILLLLVGLYILSSVFLFVQGWIMSGVTQKTEFKLRKNMSEKIGRMPMKYFESRAVGEILSRITNDIDTLGHSINQSLIQLISSIFTVVGVLIMMLLISPLMTLIVFIILPISAALISISVKFSQRYFKEQQQYLGKINGQVEESISGYSEVKLFNYEDKAIMDFTEVNEVMFSSAWKSQFISGLMHPIMNFVGNLGYVGIVISGGILVFRGSIGIGAIQAFVQYMRSFTHPIAQIAQITNLFQSMAAAAERVFEFLDEEEEVQTHENEVGSFKGQVAFDHVRFGYDPDKIVIGDFSCVIEPGQTIAIVGPTGAGKTTVVKLLMRFYDVSSGNITIDGLDIKSIGRESLRKQMGMVLQDTWLFNGSIRENIRYGKLSASDEDVIAAAKAANIHRFVQTLPGGYDMELNEDATNISQGQKQLLTIARAILANKPILILDEATSNVDTRTEHQIQKAMNNLMKGRTSFVIAHRLSTIRDADWILVMKNGDIVEQGKHEDLLAKNGFYAELYNSQFDDGVA